MMTYPNRYCSVSQNNYYQHIWGDSNNPLTGTVKFNTVNQMLEVYNGSTWNPVPQKNPDFTLIWTQEFQDIMQWAEDKMKEEKQLQEKIKKYPALQKAYQDYKILEALAHEEIKAE